MDLEGKPNKVINIPQPVLMGETDEASQTHVGVQHVPDRTELDHISPATQGTDRHKWDRSSGGTMEGS